MRDNPFFELPDYDYGPSNSNPELVWLMVCIFIVLYFNSVINRNHNVDDYFLNLIFTSIISILLFISIFVNDSSKLHIAVRYMLTPSLLMLLFLTVYYNKGIPAWLFRILLLLVLVLFNHLIPIYIHSRSAWIVIDCISIIILIFNNVYSYFLAEPLSIKRMGRIHIFQKFNNPLLMLIFPSESDESAGSVFLGLFICLLLFIAFLQI